MKNSGFTHPVNSYPEALKNVIYEMQPILQVPFELITSSILAAISHASQHAIDVKRGPITSPVSLNIVTIADSGERKSSTDSQIMKANHEHEHRCKEKNQQNLASFDLENQVWGIKHKEISLALRKAIRNEESTDQIQDRLATHLASKPDKPKTPKMIYSDSTPEALIKGLNDHWPSALLKSAEGATIFSGHVIRGMDKLNVLWDGGEIPKDLVSGGFTLQNARLTTAIMVQPAPLTAFLLRRGDIARGIGYLARCLIAYPQSTQGSRFITGSQDEILKYLPLFHTRIAEMLSTDDGTNHRKTISMEPEAFSHWCIFYNHVELMLASGRYLDNVRDFGSKLADNAARMAALFHHFLEREGDIQLDNIRSACEICTWYAHEFKALFGTEQIPQEQTDAQSLEIWLRECFSQGNNIYGIPKQQIMLCGPKEVRNTRRLNDALGVLGNAGKIAIRLHGRSQLIAPVTSYVTNPFRQNVFHNQLLNLMNNGIC